MSSVFSALAFLLGALLFPLAVGTWLVLIAGLLHSTPYLLAITAVVVLLGIVQLTRLLTKLFRNIEPDTTFLRNLPGAIGLWSFLTLLSFGLAGKAQLLEGLQSIPTHHQALGSFAVRYAPVLERWISRTAPPPVHSVFSRPNTVTEQPDAVVLTDASTPETSSTHTSAETPDAAITQALPGAHLQHYPGCSFSTQVERIRSVGMQRDALLLRCSEHATVIEIEPQTGLLQRTALFRPRSATPNTTYLQRALVVDINNDQREDLLFCTLILSERGGTRPGGGVFWSRQREGRRFDAPQRIATVDCSDIAYRAGSSTEQARLVVANWGNPYNPAHREGSLQWYRGAAGRWSLLGSVPTHVEPEQLWLEDSNHDGVLDALIAHMSSHAAGTVYPGTATGFREEDSSITGPSRTEQATQSAHLDDDTQEDSITIEAQRFTLTRTVPFAHIEVAMVTLPSAITHEF